MSWTKRIRTDRSKTRTLLAELGTRWHFLQYFSLGLISAWILLTTTGTNLFIGTPAGQTSSYGTMVFYLTCGIGHSIGLIGIAVFHRRFSPMLDNATFVIGCGIASSVGTFLLTGCAADVQLPLPVFIMTSLVTGLSNSTLVVKVGAVYKQLRGARIFTTVATSTLFANFVFFMCMAVLKPIAVVVISLLPVFAAIISFVQSVTTRAAAKYEPISPADLPRGYFTRLMLTVLVLSIAVGIEKGLSSLIDPTSQKTLVTLSVFVSFVAMGVALIVASCAMVSTRVSLGKSYYPCIVVACLVIVLLPLVSASLPAVENMLINTSYNILILAIWCMLVELESRVDYEPALVFGLGRGASIVGTTLGWGIAALVTSSPLIEYLHWIYFLIAFIVIFMITIMFSQKVANCLFDIDDSRLEEDPLDNVPVLPTQHEDARLRALDDIAKRFSLTNREQDVLFLLSKGYTASTIADELHITYNTTRSYIKGVYSKCEIHSRQDAIDLVDMHLSELR